MSKPQPPAPPNPTAVGQAQTGTNVSTAVANAGLNNVNQVTPFGSTTYNQTGGYTDPTTGQFVPSFTQTSSLSPEEQNLLTQSQGLQEQQNTLQGQQMGLTQAQLQTMLGLIPGEQQILGGTQGIAESMLPTAQTLANQAGQSATTPLNFSGVNNNIIQGGPQALDQGTAQAIYNEQAGFLGPQFAQQQKNLTDQLSQQGIPIGSPAYNDAMTQFNNSQNQAYSAASNNAIAQAIPAASNMFNMALQGQQQNISQQQLAQSNPLALLSQLYGSTGVG